MCFFWFILFSNEHHVEHTRENKRNRIRCNSSNNIENIFDIVNTDCNGNYACEQYECIDEEKNFSLFFPSYFIFCLNIRTDFLDVITLFLSIFSFSFVNKHDNSICNGNKVISSTEKHNRERKEYRS